MFPVVRRWKENVHFFSTRFAYHAADTCALEFLFIDTSREKDWKMGQRNQKHACLNSMISSETFLPVH